MLIHGFMIFVDAKLIFYDRSNAGAKPILSPKVKPEKL